MRTVLDVCGSWEQAERRLIEIVGGARIERVPGQLSICRLCVADAAALIDLFEPCESLGDLDRLVLDRLEAS